MINTNEETKLALEELGVTIKPANPQKQLWMLTNILVQSEISYRETGIAVFVTCDKMGFPIDNVEFVIGWADSITYPNQDYSGRSSMKLAHTYDPIFEQGPYWGGFLEEGIAPEVIGFGIPKGHKFEIKIFYTQLEGNN